MRSSSSKSVPMKTLNVAAIIVLSSLLACQALSASQAVTIFNSGNISYMQSAYAGAAKSQWRGVLLGASEEINANWTLMASTCASYGINFVDMGPVGNYQTAYSSVYVPTYPGINFTQAISAFHAHGIQVYADFATMYHDYIGDGIDRNCWYVPYNQGISSLQEYESQYPGSGWLDIANPASTTLIYNLTNELVSNYSIDGIAFDYTRWDELYMPLGTYDMASFQAHTGLDVGVSQSTWINDILPVTNGGTGLYTIQFFEWRAWLVDTFVQNITQWALAIKPNLKFGCTVHAIYTNEPDYWSINQGQDVAAWIKQGSIQFIMPMIYSSSISDYQMIMQAEETYTLGGAHGIVPIVPCITTAAGIDYVANYTVAQVQNFVSTLLANGADGWMISNYGGPGSNPTSDDPDIRPYLAALNLPQTFVLDNITAIALSSTSEQISWTTSSAANSTVEYSSSQLFVWSQLNATHMISTGFPYWQDNHVTGFLTSNTTSVTDHAITLTGLTPGTTYYFRIQSGDSSGMATAPVMMFSTRQTG